MATNTEIDGWTIGNSGVAVESIEKKIEEIKKYVIKTYTPHPPKFMLIVRI